MQIVNTGNIYRIYDNSVQTSQKLPVHAYQVEFSQRSGFYLSDYDDIVVSEKIYGVQEEKVFKVLNSFEIFKRNLGVILSGDKGIGKSLFAKLLAIRGMKNGYPVIIVNCYYPGIADFLSSIQQEVIVLFDEFDKTFSNKPEDSNSLNDPQTEMLTLFDGLGQGKKLFIITCNELRNVNDYLVNRPGRFHYHIRFEYPTATEIEEYLKDKIPFEYYSEIKKVVQFGRKVNLNYDCLRAIAFELSLGSAFEDAIQDLNILRSFKEAYNAILYFEDGGKTKVHEAYFDLFEDEDIRISLYDENGFNFLVDFNINDINYQKNMIVTAENLTLDWQDDYYCEDEEQNALKQRKARKPLYLKLSKSHNRKLHYVL